MPDSAAYDHLISCAKVVFQSVMVNSPRYLLRLLFNRDDHVACFVVEPCNRVKTNVCSFIDIVIHLFTPSFIYVFLLENPEAQLFLENTYNSIDYKLRAAPCDQIFFYLIEGKTKAKPNRSDLILCE